MFKTFHHLRLKMVTAYNFPWPCKRSWQENSFDWFPGGCGWPARVQRRARRVLNRLLIVPKPLDAVCNVRKWSVKLDLASYYDMQTYIAEARAYIPYIFFFLFCLLFFPTALHCDLRVHLVVCKIICRHGDATGRVTRVHVAGNTPPRYPDTRAGHCLPAVSECAAR